MSSFNWLGGALNSVFSWNQPDPNNPVVPGINDFVTINGAGTLSGSISVIQANYNGGLELAGAISTSAFQVIDGGSLTIDSGATFGSNGILNSGNLVQNGGTVSTGTGNEHTAEGAGVVASYTQSGGTHTIGADLSLGFGGTGTFDLSGGSLSTGYGEYIGQNGTGTFTQTGGSHTVGNRIVLGIDLTGGAAPLGTGTYTLGGTGTLSVPTIFIGSDPNCTGVFNFNRQATDTATLTVPATIGYPGLIVGGEGIGTFNQGHGSVSTTVAVGFRVTGDGTYNLNGGGLTSTDEKIGAAGKGQFIHKQGTNTVTGSGLVAGSAATADGTYDFRKGTVDANLETVGDAGTGLFKHSGGTNKISSNLIAGNQNHADGTYSLSGTGKLTVGSSLILGNAVGSTGELDIANVGAGASVKVADTGKLIVGNSGAGTFFENAANALVTAKLSVGAKTGGSGTFNLKAGTLTSGGETIGDYGHGTFNQSGGANGLTAAGSTLVVAARTASTGTYKLDAGTLTALSEKIGDKGTATFTQNGGSNTVQTGDLVVGNGSGGDATYDLHNGSLTVVLGDIVIGALANSSGTFNFNAVAGDAATLDIATGTIVDGDGGTGVFNFDGGTLDAGLLLGSQTGSEGTFSFQAGTLSATNADEIIGDAGTGTLTQKAGTNTIDTGSLLVGNAGGSGTYILGGTGVLTIKAGELSIGVGGTSDGIFSFNAVAADTAKLSIDTKLITVGVHGTASFIQGGGTLRAKVVVGGQVGAHGSYELDGGTLSAAGQTVGNNGTGTFTQNKGTNKISGGGDLILGAFSLGNGTYNLVGGTLNDGGELIGYAGAGSFTQSGGKNLISGTGSLLDVGTQAGSQGYYELDLGTLKTIREVIGDGGTGSFVQKGGTNTISGTTATLDIGAQGGGNGSYSLGNGTLTCLKETIGDGGQGTFTQTGGKNLMTLAGAKLVLGAKLTGHGSYEIGKGATTVAAAETIGSGGTGSFTQTGGTNTTKGLLDLGLLSKGHGTYALSAGAVTAAAEVVGDAGTGGFNQTGGSNRISGVLRLGAQASGTGSYELTKGGLVSKGEIIGDAGHGTFSQHGGMNTISGNLIIGDHAGATGTYDLLGGTLAIKAQTGVDNLVTVGVTAGASGELTVTGGKLVTPHLVIGPAGTGTVTTGNGGLITVAKTLEIHDGSTLDSSLGSVDIGTGLTPKAGTIIIGTGGTLSGSGLVTGAIRDTATGTLTASGGVMTLAGAVSGSGKMQIADGATLDLGGSCSTAATFLGNAGILKLEHADTMTGRIKGLLAGDTIDLAAIVATRAVIKTGVLHITESDGSSLSFHVAGALTGNKFYIHDNGAGGTNLVLGPKPVAMTASLAEHATADLTHISATLVNDWDIIV